MTLHLRYSFLRLDGLKKLTWIVGKSVKGLLWSEASSCAAGQTGARKRAAVVVRSEAQLYLKKRITARPKITP